MGKSPFLTVGGCSENLKRFPQGAPEQWRASPASIARLLHLLRKVTEKSIGLRSLCQSTVRFWLLRSRDSQGYWMRQFERTWCQCHDLMSWNMFQQWRRDVGRRPVMRRDGVRRSSGEEYALYEATMEAQYSAAWRDRLAQDERRAAQAGTVGDQAPERSTPAGREWTADWPGGARARFLRCGRWYRGSL